METGQLPLFQLLTSRMSWLSARQSVLAQNVANSDTPHYVARDMKPLDFASVLDGANSGNALTTTNVRHIAVTPPSSNLEEEAAEGEGGTPMGTNVSLEQEMIKLSDTQVQYQTAANLYQKAMNMFRTALGGQQ